MKCSLESLDLERFHRILVVGAGSDPYRHLFSGAEQYVALDIAPTHGVTDCIGKANALPILNESVDCVFASEVFEHLAAPLEFLNQAYSALSPGGVVIITVPFMFHQHADPADFWRPTKMALITACSRFSEVQVTSQGNRLHVISDLVTTAFSPFPIFYPLRIVNWLLNISVFSRFGFESTSPSGFLVVAKK